MSGPLLVLDAVDRTHHQGTPYLLEWLWQLGIDPRRCWRVEVFPDGDGSVRTFEYTRDGAGRLMVDATGAPEWYDRTVPLTAPIPAELTPTRAGR